MNTLIRRTAIGMVLMAGLCGCKSMGDFAVNSPTTIFRMVSSLFHHEPPKSQAAVPASSLVPMGSEAADHALAPAAQTAQVAPPAPTLDAYKTEVARHVLKSNPEQTFSGKLPEMLPAIVVLSITVDRNGNVTNVDVQRYRDTEAAWVAVTSIRVSDPLPKPTRLLATNTGLLTFSETFLFNSEYRFQLRTLAGPQ
jgi:protein TonB